jgi:hypothetical protein
MDSMAWSALPIVKLIEKYIKARVSVEKFSSVVSGESLLMYSVKA